MSKFALPSHTKVTLPADVRDAIRNGSNLAYLFNETEAEEFQLKASTEFQVQGAMLRDSFISCLVMPRVFPAGTTAYAFRHPRIGYSKYVWVGDEQYPAKGADIIHYGTDFTVVLVVDLGGHKCLANAFKSITLPVPQVVGIAD